jgi:hypothetical protein
MGKLTLTDMDKAFYLEGFQNATSQIDKKLLASAQLEVAVGTFHNSIFLKLYKKSWANPFQDPLHSPSRIFFSVWIDLKREQELSYNIHALKLRALSGYKIESRKFVDAFRMRFSDFEQQWKNVSVKFGPLTLMQGWIKIVPGNFQDETMELTCGFLKIQHLIDETLAEFKQATPLL